jgi:diaminopimelate epimerase
MRGEPADRPVIEEPLQVDDTMVGMTCVSIGNPHCVIFVEDLDGFPVAKLGPKVENHDLFPERTNVEFVAVADAQQLRMRVWERGAGETLECSTAAAAATVAAVLSERTARQVEVLVFADKVQVEWAADNHLFLTGPASEVFSGEVVLKLVEEARLT